MTHTFQISPQAVAEGEFNQAVGEAIGPYIYARDATKRCAYMRELSRRKIDRRVWSKVLRHAWTRGIEGSELSREYFRYGELAAMFRRAVPESLMQPREYRTFLKLPDSITVYRGVNGVTVAEARKGMSWTLARYVARSFSLKGDGEPVCLRGTVHKSDVLAYFTMGDSGTGERELVVRSGTVRSVERITVRRSNDR